MWHFYKSLFNDIKIIKVPSSGVISIVKLKRSFGFGNSTEMLLGSESSETSN